MQHYDKASPELLESLRSGKPLAELATTIDEWGADISGYAPIYDSQGKQVGVVGVDIKAEQFFAQQNALRRDALIGALVALVIAAFIGLLIYRLSSRMFLSEADRLQAEQALRLSETKYRTIVENMADVVCTYLPDGTITYVSDSVRRFGLEPDKTVGLNVFGFIHPDDKQKGVDALRRILNEGYEGQTGFRLRLPNGEQIQAEISSRVVRDKDGEAVQLAGIIRDITERTRLEERLRQAEKLEAIGHLAGGIAHDFNNQLTGISGYSEVLLSELENEAHRNYCERIHRAAQRARDLTRNLLAFSHKDKSQAVPFDINKIITETICLLERSLDKRIAIRNLACDGPAKAFGDPTQVQNAFLNLAVNARDAMPAGG